MKNLTDYINENLVNESFKEWIKEIAIKGVKKAEKTWNKIDSLITKNYHQPIPSILVENITSNPPIWDDPNKQYDVTLANDAYNDIIEFISNSSSKFIENDIVLYAGGRFKFDAKEFNANEMDSADLMRVWNDIISFCRKKYNNGVYSIVTETSYTVNGARNNHKITIEINNNQFYDAINIKLCEA